MDTGAFVEALPSLFGGNLCAPHPVDRRFRALLEDVPGMATENKLALLNLAARQLAPGEAYLEVGAFKGLSIIAAMLGNERSRFYAVESFREFGADRDAKRRELRNNLERWGMRDRLDLLEGNCFSVLHGNASVAGPIGAYFYDGSHGPLAHYLSLGVVEPLLADEALIVVDDASWPVVARTTDRYVGRHPGYELLVDLPSEFESDPRWWNGVRVYAYCRPDGARARRSGFDVAWRRWLHVHVTEPAVWTQRRVLSRRPRLRAVLRRALPVRSRQIRRPPA